VSLGCVTFRAWDSVLVEFDSGRMYLDRYLDSTCYGVGVYYNRTELYKAKIEYMFENCCSLKGRTKIILSEKDL